MDPRQIAVAQFGARRVPDRLRHLPVVDEAADVALCAALGVEAIITNRPGAVLAQLGRDATTAEVRAHG